MAAMAWARTAPPAGSSAPTPDVDGIIVHYTTVGRNNPFANEDDTEFDEEADAVVVDKTNVKQFIK